MRGSHVFFSGMGLAVGAAAAILYPTEISVLKLGLFGLALMICGAFWNDMTKEPS